MFYVFFVALLIPDASGWARTDNVDMSGYCPGCGGDSGENASASCPAFTPNKYRLDATGDDTKIAKDEGMNGRRMVLVAAPPADLAEANKDSSKRCMVYSGGGNTDACNNPKEPCNSAYKKHQEDVRTMLLNSVFVVCDRCPGCEEKGHRQRFDIAMSPKLLKSYSGFKFENGNFKYVPCPQDVADLNSDRKQAKHDDAVKKRAIADSGRYKRKRRRSIQVASGRSRASQ